MQKYYNNVADPLTGRPIQFASVSVQNYPSGTAATYYATNSTGTPLTAALETDANGMFQFYAADGRYQLVISKAGITPITISDILLEDPVDSPNATLAQLAAPSGSSLLGWIRSAIGAIQRTVASKLSDHINPKDFSGGSWDGVGDDTVPMQAAIAHIITLGRGVLDCRGMKINTTAAIDLLGCNNLTILDSGATFTTNGGSHFSFINGTGNFSTLLTYYNMTGSIAIGDKQLTLTTPAEAANFVAGDFVYVRTSQDVSGLTDQPIAELNKVKTSNSGTGVITFEYPFTKEYVAYSTYTHGVGKANAIVTSNVNFDGNGSYSNTGQRVFDLRHVWNLSICGKSNISGRGGVVLRGKFLRCDENIINLTVNWSAPLWRPYFFAVDTGSSDSSFSRNKCNADGIAFVHIHEGQSNASVDDNEFFLPATDTHVGVETWPVISFRGRSWSVKARRNQLNNSPLTDAILCTSSAVEATKGHADIEVSDNTIQGTVAGRGINFTDAYSLRQIISFNKVSNYTTNSIRTVSSGGTLHGNIVPAGSTDIATGNDVGGNIGFCSETKFFSINDLSLFSGTPALATYAGGRAMAWMMDAAANELLQCGFLVPPQATKWTVKLHWTNAGAGAGDVVWYLNPQGFVDGENMSVADGTIATTTVTAGTQDYLKVTTLLTNAALTASALAAGDMARLRIARSATAGGDTLANDAGVIGLEVTFS